MDSKNVIASAISDNELARAFSELVAERWDNWDLTEFLPYLVDTCAPTTLPYLADQFDIDGLRGFGMAITEEQQRDIIKRSIALHKFLGTPWAMREACRTIGFPVIILEEGITYTRNGAYGKAYGSAYSMPTETFCWACFRVLVEANMSQHITADKVRKIRRFVEYYKNERSHLVELGFFQQFPEEIFRTDISERDQLDVFILSVEPNPVILSVSGSMQVVSIFSTAPWSIEPLTYSWGDETDDKISLAFTGEAGYGSIIIESDPYSMPDSGGSRIMTIPILSTDGRELGMLTVEQKATYSSGYGAGYSSAYNSPAATIVDTFIVDTKKVD